MEVTKIALERFKKISEATIDLAPINILVGGNNSGKSSVLEGIHFTAVAAVAARIADTRTFTQDSLPFCPTRDFVQLRHGAPYKNQSNFGYLRIYAADAPDELTCTVKIYRGRNDGNVGCEVTGSVSLRNVLQNKQRPFSVYVPGLSGIPQVEECRTESVVRRGVASGDANLYLRNVLLLIRQRGLMDELEATARALFPRLHIYVSFYPETDLYIDVQVSLTGPHGRRVPLELVGTGVQQALQIFSYVVLFRPVLLLLDEPDSHLHPDNQGLLAKVMLAIASETDTKVLATTHSRHLVDALYDESNIVWLKDGEVYQQGDDVGRIPLLMDIGALDSFERLREGAIRWAILTEDASIELIDSLLRASGFDPDEYVIYSYKTSSNIQSALTLADFIGEIAPATEIIVHRDRDFMLPVEVDWITNQIESAGASAYITEGSDIDAQFLHVDHIASLLDVTPEVVDQWLDDIARENHNDLMHKFTRKRDDLKYLYRKRPENPPDTITLIGQDNPLPHEKRLGKFMLRKARAGMHAKFGRTVDITNPTDYLVSERLVEIRETANGA